MKPHPDEQQVPLRVNWWEVLKNPPAMNSPFHKELIDLSFNWTTCACGNLCDLIPRQPDNNAPLDIRLQNLGCDFHCYVSGGRWQDARETLQLIEKRSLEVLRELYPTFDC